MRQLERLGHCTEVEVEIVPLSKVPPNVFQEMGTEQHSNDEHMQSEETKKQCRMRCRAAQHHRRIARTKQHRFACSQHNHTCCVPNGNGLVKEAKSVELKPLDTHTKKSKSSEGGTTTATTSSTTTSFSLNGFNTYLSDQQLRAARMSNTMTVMAPCLRQPITTSTPASDLSMRQFKWHFCCAEGHSGKMCQNANHKSSDQCQSGLSSNCKWQQCDSGSSEDAANAIPSCCICSNARPNDDAAQRCPTSCPSTSSHHHCLHNHSATHESTAAQICHSPKTVHGCTQHAHRIVKPNCLNNNCEQEDEEEEEEGETDDEDEDELSSDNEEEEEEEEEEDYNEQKCNSNQEDEDEESDEEDNETNEDDDDEDEDEDDENLNCGNSFNMRVLHRPGFMSDEEQDEDENEDEHKEMELCLHEVELFACNVCDRTYHTARSLAKHQVHKRHFGCSICDTVFPTLLSLEQHKHTLEHWSDDDESTLSLSLSGSTSKHHCSVNRMGHPMRHNHPILANSSHGYPSDSLLLHNHAHNGEQNGQQKQTKLSLHNTTIAGLLEGKWAPSLNGHHGAVLNGSNDHLASRKWFLGTQHRAEQSIVDSRCKTTQPVSIAKSKPILASSLSSKLMASVFNFSSSNASLLSTHSDPSQAKATATAKQQQQQLSLNSQKRLSRSTEEMESLL